MMHIPYKWPTRNDFKWGEPGPFKWSYKLVVRGTPCRITSWVVGG